jgi:hypothetical protein
VGHLPALSPLGLLEHEVSSSSLCPLFCEIKAILTKRKSAKRGPLAARLKTFCIQYRWGSAAPLAVRCILLQLSVWKNMSRGQEQEKIFTSMFADFNVATWRSLEGQRTFSLCNWNGEE